MKWHNIIYRPFAYLHLRMIQRRYRALTLYTNDGRGTNMNLAKLRLLQAKEEYYKSCFDAWGIFHPNCVCDSRHFKRMDFLFPDKDFKEQCTVKWYSEEIVDHYRNLLHKHGVPTPVWNKSFCGPGTYDFGKLDLPKGNIEILTAVKNCMKKKR